MFANYLRLSRNTKTLSLTVGIVLTAFFMWSPLLALHMRALGMDEFQIGVAFSVFTLMHTLPAMGGGMLADRFGRKWVITAPAFALIPGYIIAALTQNALIFVLALTLTNTAGALQWPAMQALTSESDEAQRARAFSLIEIFVLSAAIVGPLVGSFLFPFIGFGGLMLLHAAALVPATIMRSFWLQETHHARHRAGFKLQDWRAAIPRGAWFIIGANALFALTLGLSSEGPFVTLLAHDRWGLDEQQIQWLNALGGFVALAGVWLGSRADRWGSRRMWIVCAAVLALALTGWGLSPNWQIALIFFIAGHICFETIFIVNETLLSHYSIRATRSFLFGFSQTVGNSMSAAGPTIGAALVSLAGLSATFIAAAAASLIGIGALVPVRDTVGPKEPGTEEFVIANPAE